MGRVFQNNIHCIGIKGSGMAALAVLLSKMGYSISGTDHADHFHTDTLLLQNNIQFSEGFSPSNIPPQTQTIIYSAAYSKKDCNELAHAMKHFPCFSYPEALGMLSKAYAFWTVIGTHGKTSTAALIALMCKTLSLPTSVLVGGVVQDLNDNAIWHNGEKAFFTEVCEYKNHLSKISPSATIFTSAEWDHPDYFRNEAAVYKAFANFLHQLPSSSPLIACLDNNGVKNTLHLLSSKKKLPPHLKIYGYGRTPHQNISHINTHKYVHIHNTTSSTKHNKKHMLSFSISGLSQKADSLQWHISKPPEVLIDNSVAALLTMYAYAEQNKEHTNINYPILQKMLLSFKGVRRRCEIVYKNASYLILDDYGHHPTAIAHTLQSIKEFYSPRRLIVDFMSHTYTRTIAFWDEFIFCFDNADILIINDIYSSEREKTLLQNSTDITAYDAQHLCNAISKRNISHTQYIHCLTKTAEHVCNIIQEGDVFVTMGAGDTFRVAAQVKKFLLKLENK